LATQNPKRVAGQYNLEDVLGKGGMGTVYKGIDTHTGMAVAVKHLRTELATDDMIERFRREGEALRLLNHPNIVKMLDAVQDLTACHFC